MLKRLSRICWSAHNLFESAQLLRNRHYVIVEFVKDRSSEQYFLPFIPRQWWKLAMSTELYNINMPTTRSYKLLCPRCHLLMKPYNWNTGSLCSTPMVCRKWLALNPDKSEAVLFSTSQRAKGLSAILTIDAVGSAVALSSKIKLLGVTLDGNLNFNDQVKNVCRASLFHIRALRNIRLSLTEEMANVVACALVQSRDDYANSLYTGMSSVIYEFWWAEPHSAITQETTLATDPSTCRFQGRTIDQFVILVNLNLWMD